MLIKNTNRNKQLLNHIATEWRFFSKRIFQTPFLQSLVPVYRGEDYFCIFANQEKEPPMAAIFLSDQNGMKTFFKRTA
jgi:hypothetical protein